MGGGGDRRVGGRGAQAGRGAGAWERAERRGPAVAAGVAARRRDGGAPTDSVRDGERDVGHGGGGDGRAVGGGASDGADARRIAGGVLPSGTTAVRSCRGGGVGVA